MSNLFSNLPKSTSDELVDVLASNRQVRIERIVSNGHKSPEGFWYDQNENEWVAILAGEAKLLIEGEDAPLHLAPGDHVLIPAHQRHRVESTSESEPTVWLAVFFAEDRTEDHNQHRPD